MIKKNLQALMLIVLALISFMSPAGYAAQTTLPADGYLSNSARTNAQMQQALEDVDSVIMELLGGRAEKSVTSLASDAFTPSVDYAVYPIQPESGTADNLATISTSGARDGSVLAVRNNSAVNTITIKHGTGNIFLATSADLAINATGDYVVFILRGSNWYELFRTNRAITKLSDLPTTLILQQHVRMSLTSGAPDDNPSGSKTASTVRICPYGGNSVSLPDTTGDVFTRIAFSEINQSIGSDDCRIKDVFLYNNAGAVAAELNAWDSGGTTSAAITGATAASPCVLTSNNSLSAGDIICVYGVVGTMGTDANNGLNGKLFRVGSRTGTTITLEAGNSTAGLTYTSGGTWVKVPQSRTDALTLRNGVYLKNADKSRLYIGTIVVGNPSAAGAGTTEDDRYNRLVWNYFNRLPRAMECRNYNKSSSHTYTTNTTRPFDLQTSQGGGGATRLNWVIGIADETHNVSIRQQVASSAAGGLATAAMSIDGTGSVAFSHYATETTDVANQEETASGSGPIMTPPPIGLHFYQYQEAANGGTVMTWTSDTANGTSSLSVLGRWRPQPPANLAGRRAKKKKAA